MTLLDMAIALLVISILMAPTLYTYNRWRLNEITNVTEENVELSVKQAIDEFFFSEGRYPCPSNITLPPDDPLYGVENCPAQGTPPFNLDVLQGGVPFATLKIPSSMALDGWSNRLLYAVTQVQANPNIPGNTPNFNFPANGGRIRVSGVPQEIDPVTNVRVCDFGAGTNGAYGTANHYVTMSYGEQAMGAYNAEGRLVQACPAGGTSADTENCDGDTDFWHQTCSHNTAAGAGAFDDFLYVGAQMPTDTWMTSKGNDEDIITSDQFVGIGKITPGVTLDVTGNIRVEATGEEGKNGQVRSDRLCNNNAYVWGGNSYAMTCFSPSLIAGNDPNMRCAAEATAMSGVAYNRANCTATYIPQRQSACPANQLVTGITSTGQVICSAL